MNNVVRNYSWLAHMATGVTVGFPYQLTAMMLQELPTGAL
jgi:hypothetical protein